MKRVALLPALLTIALAVAIFPPGRPSEAQPLCAPETGFCISNSAFQQYYQVRGEFDTLGYPISREFLLDGFRVQFFQRVVLQQQGQNVERLNLLDAGIMPLTRANGSVFPPPDPALASAAPDVGSPQYAERTVEFIRSVSPDSFEGLPVSFFSTFNSAVPIPPGTEPNIQALLNLEIWGVPTSQPAFDPTNPGFVYQRFQRGIMHFRAACSCTEGILIGDYFKSVITGQNLPLDLAQDMATSRFLYQWQPGAPNSLTNPSVLPNSDLTNAFVPELPGFATPPPAPRPELPVPVPTPTPSEPSTTPTPTPAPEPDTGPSVSIQLDDDDIDPSDLIRVTGIASDDEGLEWIELVAERRDDNEDADNEDADNEDAEDADNEDADNEDADNEDADNEDADNDDNGNDNEATGDPVLDEERRFECDDRTDCANVWELRPEQPGEYTLRVRARDTDGQERSATTELNIRD